MPEPLPVNLPPAEAVEWFRAKGYQISWGWQDVYAEQHGRAFTVAKAMRMGVLEDIRGAVDHAIAEGATLREFARDLTPRLQAAGWWGGTRMVDPRTGEEKDVQLGSPRRLETIFDTNLRTAYAAGEVERQERTKARRPYLRYVAILDGGTRPEHRAWHGTVLPADDPWWSTHYPPNGWGCRCAVQQLSDADLERYGYQVSSTAPPSDTYEWRNPRSGEVRQVPGGIDPGFDHNPGATPWRGITPRELPPALAGSPPGPGIARPLPAARPTSAERLLPTGLREEEYATRFLEEFGAAPGRPVVWKDPLGEPVIISDDLFRTADGVLKVTKRERERALLLLADTIKSPDEIWAAWEVSRETGKVLLRRRYLGRWVVAGRKEPALVVWEYSPAGWRGTTAFNTTESVLAHQRRGTLLHRREE